MKTHPVRTLHSTIYRLLLIPSLVTLLVFVVISAVGGGLLYGEVSTQQRLVSELVARQSKAYLSETQALITAMANAFIDLTPGAQVDLLRHIRANYPRFTALFLLDANGWVLIEEKPAYVSSLVGYDLSGENYFRDVRRTGQPFFSDTFFSVITDDIAVTLAVPLYNHDGQFDGVLVGEMNLELLQQTVQQMEPSGGNMVFILDKHGTVLAHPDYKLVRQQVNLGDMPLLDGGLSQPGFNIFYDSNLRSWLIGSAHPIGNSWVVICIRPLFEAARPMFILLALSGLAFAFGLAFFGVIFRFALRRVTLPIQHLVQIAEAISEGRQTEATYDASLDAYSEISVLMISFERMLRTINERTGELTEANRQLALELHEHQRAELELIQHREHLEELVAVRTADLQDAYREMESFSYSVSHDLRAPLRHIDGFSGILLENYADRLDDEGRAYLQHVRDGTADMSRLIDGLLQLSRLTRGELNKDRVDLSRLATEVARDLQQTSPTRDVTWVIAPNCIETADSRLMRALLQNLLGNAWKFSSTREQARIEFGILNSRQVSEKWDTTPLKTVYFVRDNGVGFDMAYSDHLFSPFQRLHRQDEFPGTGIGLATVQRIVHRHGGRLWAESKVNLGAIFYFTL